MGAGARGNHPAQHLIHFTQRRIGDGGGGGRAFMPEDHPAGARADAFDAIGGDAIAAIGKGVIGLGHLQGCHQFGSQRHGRLDAQGRDDAEMVGGGGHIGPADFVGQARGHGVDRLRQGGLQGDRAQELGLEVARRPAVDGHRFVDRDGVGGAAGLHGGQIDERFPRRAGLAVGAHRPVVGARGIVHPADQGAHPPGPIQRHQRGLACAGVGETGGHSARRLAGCGLGAEIQGRIHHQVGAQRPGRLAHRSVHPVDEILRRSDGGALEHLGRMGQGAVALGGGNGAGVDHGGEHHGGALGRPLGLFGRVVFGGRLGNGGQHGRLAQSQALGGLVEVAL